MWLFRKQHKIFAVVTVSEKDNKEQSVIMLSLHNFKTIYPEKKRGTEAGFKESALFMTFGSNEVKFVWSSNRLILNLRVQANLKYFDHHMSLLELFEDSSIDF